MESWYVYQHVRDDKNEIFYIGIGCKKDTAGHMSFGQINEILCGVVYLIKQLFTLKFYMMD